MTTKHETAESKTTKQATEVEEVQAVSIDEEPAEANEPVYKLTISENVVEKISAKAVQKVDGIVAMKGGLFSTIQEGLGGSSETKGVSADLLDDNSVSVDLDVILEYGKSAVDIFESIKGIVVEDVESMTGLRVSELVVNVVDVMSQEEYNKKRKKTDDEEDENEDA